VLKQAIQAKTMLIQAINEGPPTEKQLAVKSDKRKQNLAEARQEYIEFAENLKEQLLFYNERSTKENVIPLIYIRTGGYEVTIAEYYQVIGVDTSKGKMSLIHLDKYLDTEKQGRDGYWWPIFKRPEQLDYKNLPRVWTVNATDFVALDPKNKWTYIHPWDGDSMPENFANQ
jgi:hypothetical protein